MEKRLRLHGLWFRRKETLDDCVQRVNTTFHGLSKLTKDWRQWYLAYGTVADPRVGIPDNLKLIKEEFLRGQVTGPNGEPVEDLGFRLISWAARAVEHGDRDVTNLRLKCCVTSLYQPNNSISIELPVRDLAEHLYDAELLSQAAVVLAEVWDPDWLAVWELLPEFILVPRPWENGPVLGWVNYLPERTGVIVGDLPPRWRWYEQRGERQIFIHEGGPVDPQNPEHVRAFEEMGRCIRWGTDPHETVSQEGSPT